MPDAGERPLLMGILNVTPDSFYDGGRWDTTEAAVRRGLDLVESGADVVDVGGESTRPGADPVGLDEELDRVVPVVRALARRVDVPISVDTSKAEVARRALEAGAGWVNDVTALRGDPSIGSIVAEHDARLVLMHMQGTPATMQEDPRYDDVVDDVREFLERRAERALEAGVPAEDLLVDPGIGFGKRLEHNRALLRNVGTLRATGYPVLVGHSRKSFLGEVLGRGTEDRLAGTLAVSEHLMASGVDVLRVHDVAAHRDLRRTRRWLGER